MATQRTRPQLTVWLCRLPGESQVKQDIIRAEFMLSPLWSAPWQRSSCQISWLLYQPSDPHAVNLRIRQKHQGWIKLFHCSLTTAHWASGFIFQTSDGPSGKDKRSLPASSVIQHVKWVHSQNAFAWAPQPAGDEMPIWKRLSRDFPGAERRFDSWLGRLDPTFGN